MLQVILDLCVVNAARNTLANSTSLLWHYEYVWSNTGLYEELLLGKFALDPQSGDSVLYGFHYTTGSDMAHGPFHKSRS